MKTFAEQKVHWLGQAAFRVGDGPVVFTDPYQLKAAGAADLILITHSHRDHLSPADIEKIRTPATVIVAPDDPECRKQLTGDVRFLRPGDTLTARGVEIQAVPAYNLPPKSFHPRSRQWVGYLFAVDGVRLYTAGDTDRIPEMQGLRVDIALLPVGGRFTMDAGEAAAAAGDIRPKLAIPMHSGSVVGSRRDAENFQQRLAGRVEVLIQTAE